MKLTDEQKDILNGKQGDVKAKVMETIVRYADMFEAGETVTGIVRSIEEYGVFIELAPNLAGLAEPRDCVHINRPASVYIKAIIPEKMKVKLKQIKLNK